MKSSAHRPKLAKKIDREAKRKKKEGKSKSSFEQATAPFHPVGEMPSQYAEAQSELKKVSRVKRRMEW